MDSVQLNIPNDMADYLPILIPPNYLTTGLNRPVSSGYFKAGTV